MPSKRCSVMNQPANDDEEEDDDDDSGSGGSDDDSGDGDDEDAGEDDVTGAGAATAQNIATSESSPLAGWVNDAMIGIFFAMTISKPKDFTIDIISFYKI